MCSPGAEDVLIMATALLLLSLCAAGVLSSDVDKRLVSGTMCRSTDRLYHARVVYEFRNGTRMTCGGTLIHREWVITASHCYGGRDGTLKVELGGHPKTAVKKQLRIKKKDVWIYAKSQSEELIMLVKLPETIKNIPPAALPAGDCMAPSDGDELQVSGRGATTAEGGPGVKDLMCLKVKVLEKSHCGDLSGTGFENQRYIYCGGAIDGTEIKACKGDSGSGLMKKEMVSKSSFIFWTKEEEVDMLYGVLVTGHNACDDKFVFVDICAKSIKRWIDKKMA